MFISQQKAFRFFLKENPMVTIGLSASRKLRLKYVLKYSKIFHFMCQCPYCVNVEKILDAFKRRISRSNLNDHDQKKMKLYTVQDTCDVLMCEKEAGK